MAEFSECEPESSKTNLEQFLTCSLCLNILKEPRSLPCFHSFCSPCLEERIQPKIFEGVEVAPGTRSGNEAQLEVEKPSSESICPTCNAFFGSETEVKHGQFVRNMLESLTVGEETQLCTSCDNNFEALCHCPVCSLFLCSECFVAHQNWPVLKKHPVVMANEWKNVGRQLPSQLKCMKHPEKTLKFFCETCQELICRYCHDFEHAKQSHPCSLVKDAAEDKKEKLETSNKSLMTTLAKESEFSASLSDINVCLHENFTKAMTDIQQHKEAILKSFMQQLDKRFDGLTKKLNQEYDQRSGMLMEQKRTTDSSISRLETVLKLSKNLVEFGSHEDVLVSTDVWTEVAELKKLDERKHESMKQAYTDASLIYYKLRKPSVELQFQPILDKNLGKVAIHSALSANSSILRDKDIFVDQLEEWVGDRFKWRMCYRATEHGWGSKQFHSFCDRKGSTVTVVKVGEFIFGGFTDRNWEGISFKKSDCSFLFSLQNKDNLPPFRCPIYRNAAWAIFRAPNFGPTFGCEKLFSGTFDSNDLFICDNAASCQLSHTNLGGTYKPPKGYEFGEERTRCLLAGTYKFTPTEIEVFN